MYFFIVFKKAKLEENLLTFTCLNRFIIGLAFMLGTLMYYTTVSHLLYRTGLFFLSNDDAKEKGIYYVLEFEKEVVSPFLDLMSSLAILYLFYSLGIKKIRAEQSQRMGASNSFKQARSQYKKKNGGGRGGFDELDGKSLINNCL